MAIQRITPTKNGKENNVAVSNQQPKSSDNNRDDDGDVDMNETTKSPYNLYFDQQKAWLKQHKEVLGPRMIKGIDSDDEESEDDDEEDVSKYTTEQMNSLRYIMVTKHLETQFHAMHELVLGDQANQQLMMFDTSFSLDVLHSWDHFSFTFSTNNQPSQKLDLLIAYTTNLQEFDVWMHDNEGGMEVLVEGLASAWKELLQEHSDEELGWDMEYTKPGVMELLKQFKTSVEVYNGKFDCFPEIMAGAA